MIGVKMSKEKDIKYPKVEILWEDIVNFSRVKVEELKENLDDYRLYKKEVGYLILKNDEVAVIINDFDLDNGGDNYGTVFPAGCIIDIKELKYDEDDDNRIKLLNYLMINKEE